MPATHEENGIVFFEKPYKVKLTEWIPRHLDCNALVEKGSVSSLWATIICYAKSRKDNITLLRLKRERFTKASTLVGVRSDEVNSID